MLIQIYVDDVLKYTSPQFGKTSGRIDFKVDVTGGQKLTIKAGLASGHGATLVSPLLIRN